MTKPGALIQLKNNTNQNHLYRCKTTFCHIVVYWISKRERPVKM